MKQATHFIGQHAVKRPAFAYSAMARHPLLRSGELPPSLKLRRDKSPRQANHAGGSSIKPQNDISECGSWKIEEKTKAKGNSSQRPPAQRVAWIFPP